jgi:hypothetical protein
MLLHLHSYLSAAITRQCVVPEAFVRACDGDFLLMSTVTTMAERSSSQREKSHSLQQHFWQLMRGIQCEGSMKK